jgi:hypothetical protein
MQRGEESLNNVERFRAVMAFEPADRLPVLEWAPWWDETLKRWYGEGLPAELTDAGAIRDYLGLDRHAHAWIRPRWRDLPELAGHRSHRIRDVEHYTELRPRLYPDRPFDAEPYRAWGEAHERGEVIVWLTMEGFFWYPRILFGIERHLYAFYDEPELMHLINRDLLEHNLRIVEEFCSVCPVDFTTFAEDMSYNHGPMLSKALFDEFLAPYYRQIVPALKRHGILPMVDSDGDVTELIPWLEDVGVEGLLPLERMAGVDVARIRARHPQFRMIGAFDKTVMKDGEGAIRAEFERLLPVMRMGGFIPSVDHQTPPDVSLEQYRRYVPILREYCERAAL